MITIRNRFIPFGRFDAINILGVVFCRRDSELTPSLLRHEQIHTRQMMELLVVGFYVWYVLEWLVRLFLPGNAYSNISFEREAYRHMHDEDYMKRRHHFAWLRYLHVRAK